MSESCKARIYSDSWGRSHGCKNAAKKDGYCMLHHPDVKARKDAERQKEWERKREQDPLRVAHRELLVMKQQRDELLAALKSLNYTASDNCYNAKVVRVAIAKVEGGAA